MTLTVIFDVGGKLYRVSKSLVKKYPNSILGKAVSKNKDDLSAPIFIESDSDRFRYILDYMRHGKVFLPDSVPRDAVLNDLNYLDFRGWDEKDIISQPTISHHASPSVPDVVDEVEQRPAKRSRAATVNQVTNDTPNNVNHLPDSIHFGSGIWNQMQPGLQNFLGGNYHQMTPYPTPDAIWNNHMEQPKQQQMQHLLELQNMCELKYHQIRWDDKRAPECLTIENEKTTLKKSSATCKWDAAVGELGFSSGSHCWNIKIVRADEFNSIRIGVASRRDESMDGAYDEDKCVCYDGRTGELYVGTTNFTFGENFTTGDVIGTLLNLYDKTVTFYKNAIRIGTAIDKLDLEATAYYPFVSLFRYEQEVSSCPTTTKKLGSTIKKSGTTTKKKAAALDLT